MKAALRPNDVGIASAIDRLYDAAFDDEGWEYALSGLTDITGSEGSLLFVTHDAGEVGDLAATSRISPDLWAEYGAGYAARDPRRRYVNSNPIMHIAYDYRHTSEEEIDAEPLYQWLTSYGLRYYMGTVLSRDMGTCHIRVQRTPGQGHAGQQEIEIFSTLLPHAARAVKLRQRLARHDAVGICCSKAMDRIDFGVILLDSAGGVIHANAMAEMIGERGDGLSFAARGVSAAVPEDNRQLQLLIGGALGHAALREARLSGGQLSVQRLDGTRPYHVQILPLKLKTSPFGRRVPAAVLFVTDAGNRAPVGADQLRALFGFTCAEARLAAHLVTGASIAVYAATVGLKYETARGYTKRIYAKAGAHTQADLVSILRRSVSPIVGEFDA